jgi:hypothetical protein
MVYVAQVELACLDSLKSDRARERCIEYLLVALAQCNLEFLKANHFTPPLYKSGVTYCGDMGPDDPWKDIPQVLKDGCGDCDDLVPWRLAELWLRGVQASPVAHLETDSEGNALFHVTIATPSGDTEDPSIMLGM